MGHRQMCKRLTKLEQSCRLSTKIIVKLTTECIAQCVLGMLVSKVQEKNKAICICK